MSSATELAEFLERHGEEILGRWEETVQRLESARSLPRIELRDHLPAVLEALANAMRAGDGSTQIFLVDDAHHTHVLHRLKEGFDLGQLMEEVSLLREAIFHVLARRREVLEPEAVRTLNAAVDRVVADGATLFLRAKRRTLEAIERISAATLESASLDGLLERLLEIFEHTTAAADSVAVLLIRGSELELRAVAGREADRLATGARYPSDAGLAGEVVKSGEAVERIRRPTDPRPSEDLFCHDRICCHYAIPLTFSEELLGVAEMVSHSAHRFSEEDKYLFHTLTSRATAIIHQHMLRESLEEMYAKEQRAVRARDELLAVVSHDLRDPIHRIALGTEILLRLGSMPGDDSRRTVEQIRAATQQMDRLIADLLTKASLEQGEIEIDGSRVRAERLVGEAADAARLVTDGRKVRIRIECAPDCGEVSCDPDRIHQVFSNLVHNALDFVSDDGTITLGAIREEERVVFFVSDDGPGIPEELRDQVFEPYFSRRTEGDKGTGLGLYIVKRLVEAQGGHVDIETADGGGTTVRFSLPLAAE